MKLHIFQQDQQCIVETPLIYFREYILQTFLRYLSFRKYIPATLPTQYMVQLKQLYVYVIAY
jgi:hypothetical protein